MDVFDALGSPVRRDILRELRGGPRSVGELAERFPVSRPAISRHLGILAEGGLVEARSEGTKNLYALRPQGFQPLRELLDELWDDALTRLQDLGNL